MGARYILGEANPSISAALREYFLVSALYVNLLFGDYC